MTFLQAVFCNICSGNVGVKAKLATCKQSGGCAPMNGRILAFVLPESSPPGHAFLDSENSR